MLVSSIASLSLKSIVSGTAVSPNAGGCAATANTAVGGAVSIVNENEPVADDVSSIAEAVTVTLTVPAAPDAYVSVSVGCRPVPPIVPETAVLSVVTANFSGSVCVAVMIDASPAGFTLPGTCGY